LQCRNCGDVVDPRRVELGYDYCLKEVCQQRYLKRVHLAAVGVNKAADYYMKAEEVLPPRPSAPAEVGSPGTAEAEAACTAVAGAAEVGGVAGVGGLTEVSAEPAGAEVSAVAEPKATRPTPRRDAASKTSRSVVGKGPKTTLERLREQEAALDGALDRSYERFRRGEITATELHAERDRMIGAFNRLVMRENIRYRSMLRGPAHRAG
jgi:hypothetical protein